MSLVLANIDYDFQITYVFIGFEHVGSTKTMVSGTQVSQNVGFRRFPSCKNLSILDFPLARPERPPGHKKSMLLDNRTQPILNYRLSVPAETFRNTILIKTQMKYQQLCVCCMILIKKPT